MRARAVLALLAVAAIALTGLVQPASACGCGAVIANDRVQVDGESSIVRWDGSTEQIVMRLAVDSRSPDAAWVFPTPSVATVRLGDRRWFSQIDALTAPRVRVITDWWPRWRRQVNYAGANPGAPGTGSVHLLTEQRLGSLVVATLDATDAGALSGWLGAHGYRLRPELAGTLQVYVAQHWKYVAVKLAPKAASSLRGQLDPLQVSFASPRLVYPMYLSHLAATTQHVHLWVVAPHEVRRVDPDASRLPGVVQFSGPVPAVDGSLGGFVGAGQWLTEIDNRIYQPARITADWRFDYATADRPYREIETRYDAVYVLGIPGGWFLVGVGTLAVLAVLGLTLLVVLVVMPRRRPAAGR